MVELAILLEQNQEDVEELKKVVLELNSSMEFKVFEEVEQFAEWFGELNESPPEDDFQLSLLISNRKILGQKHRDLFTKISAYMQKKGYLPEEKARIPILITAQNASEFKRESYYLDIFDNIIYKPFDHQIAKGKINWALCGHDALSSEELTKQVPASPLEMTKTVRVDRITELGFRTISKKEIPLGRLARYYMPSLKPLGDDYGIFASCTQCERIEGEDAFLCSFSFFGVDPLKAKNIRRLLAGAENVSDLPLEDSPSQVSLGVIVVSEERDLCERLERYLNSSFANIETVVFKTFSDFYSEIDLEAGFKAWLEQQQKIEPIVAEYGYHDHVFHQAYDPQRPEEEVEQYLGLNKNDLFDLRSLVFKKHDEKERIRLGKYWDSKVDEACLLKFEHEGREVKIALAKSEVFNDDETGQKRVRIHMRPPELEELEKIKEDGRLPERSRLLLLGESVFKRQEIDFWKEVEEKLSLDGVADCTIVVGKTPLTLYEQAYAMEGLTDYIIEPFDQTYLKKKIKYAIPEMEVSETVPARVCSHTDEEIQVGVQVKVKNFSEVSLSVEYSRELEKDAFRSFIIFIQAEGEFEELIAKHVDTEKINDQLYLNHFTLFGHGDDTNQKIRHWLNEQYALNKKE